MNSQETEYTVYLSYDASIWLQPYKGQHFLEAAKEGHGIDVQNKDYLSSLS
jgi:hypothetical protein